jgi:hypothetical protein
MSALNPATELAMIEQSTLTSQQKAEVKKRAMNTLDFIDIGIKRYANELEGPLDILSDKSVFPDLNSQVNFWEKLGRMDRSELQVTNYFLRKGQNARMVAYVEAPRERGLGKEEDEETRVKTRSEIFDEHVLKKALDPAKKVAKYGFVAIAVVAGVMHNEALKATVDIVQKHMDWIAIGATTLMGLKTFTNRINTNTFYNFNIRSDIASGKRENRNREWQTILDNAENIPQKVRQVLIALPKSELYDLLEIKDDKIREKQIATRVREFNPEKHTLQTFFNKMNIAFMADTEKYVVQSIRKIGEITGVQGLTDYKKDVYHTEQDKKDDVATIKNRIEEMRMIATQNTINSQMKIK